MHVSLKHCLAASLALLAAPWAYAETPRAPPLAEKFLQLAMKTKPPTCVPVLCWIENTGWCMCDPCTHVVDCRAATGGKRGTVMTPKLDSGATIKEQAK
ncbi:hypothetical protein [Aestuariivirga sp.]|uniref:hypothetical protein n=1 Tax=Aestuariivirga sp. TaxID=2650926 RepID=UPI00391D2290